MLCYLFIIWHSKIRMSINLTISEKEFYSLLFSSIKFISNMLDIISMLLFGVILIISGTRTESVRYDLFLW